MSRSAELHPSQSRPSRDDRWSSLQHHAEPWRLPATPTLVVVPHPDDETLLAGGLIATQRARDVDVRILAVTDGEAAYDDVDGLAARRRCEQISALDRLGVPADAVGRLGLPDGDVASHVDAVTDAISAVDGIGLIVAPWTGDHHCDHEAVGRAARAAADRTGTALVYGLFWTWHRRDPAELAGERMLALVLSDEARSRRRRAVRCHRSQFDDQHGRPQLDDDLIRPLDWSSEYFLASEPSAEHR
jgi:LmbE family N-acetylglucosaminyl deacetylase